MKTRITSEASAQRTALIEKLWNAHGGQLRTRASIAEQVIKELGCKCTLGDVTTITTKFRRAAAEPKHVTKKTAPVSTMQIITKPSLQRDIETVYKAMKALGLSEITIKHDGKVSITKIQQEHFNLG